MAGTIQRSFAAGEIGPDLYARADQVKYATGLRTCRNMVVQKHGGAVNRGGLRFCAVARDGALTKPRIIPFAFDETQTYAIEFGVGYLRFLRDGELLTVSGVTAWNSATAYEIGDLASSGGVNYYCIADHTNQAPPDAGYWYALTGDVYEIPSPYAEADLPRIQRVQSADVVTLTHSGYKTRELLRYGETRWVLRVASFLPGITHPTGVTGTPISGSGVYRYKVTAIDADTYEESLAGLRETTFSVTGATNADPCVLEIVSHDLENGDEVYIDEIGGMTELNGRRFVVDVIDSDNIELRDVDSTDYGTYTSGGTSARTHVRLISGPPDGNNPIEIEWDAVPNAVEYNVYKSRASNGIYGYVGTAAETLFNDYGSELNPMDKSIQPPIYRDPFTKSGENPAVCSYYQQRLVLANVPSDKEKVWTSRTGEYHNFSISRPSQDDDAVTFSLAGRQVNEIRHVVDIGGRMVVLTSGAEWVVNGDANGALVPTAIGAVTRAYNGAAWVQPAMVSDSLLYIQDAGNIVRDFRVAESGVGYASRDLSIFAPHLFEGFEIVDCAYAQVPNSVVWFVRSDGVLLGLTYLPEHDVWGWHRHDTAGGKVESICVIRENRVDIVYATVLREFSYGSTRTIERLDDRRIADQRTDAFFVDSGVTYDGRDLAHGSARLTGGSTWQANDIMTLQATGASFDAGMVGKRAWLRSEDEQARVEITAYSSSGIVTVRAVVAVPESLREAWVTDWALCTDTVTGLDHLEGATVAALADGFVQSQQVVSGGAVTFANQWGVIHVGLPIEADIETLDMDSPDSRDPLVGRRKNITEVGVYVKETRGLWAGSDADHLTIYKQRATETMNDPIALKTGLAPIIIQSTWTDHGRVFIRQPEPLPMTILAVVPRGFSGG